MICKTFHSPNLLRGHTSLKFGKNSSLKEVLDIKRFVGILTFISRIKLNTKFREFQRKNINISFFFRILVYISN